MNILIAGGSGFIGQGLINYIYTHQIDKQLNLSITVLTRNIKKTKAKFKAKFDHNLNFKDWSSFENNHQAFGKYLADFDIIINLCGKSIGDHRWSSSYKQEILDSRVKPTKFIAAAAAELYKSTGKKVAIFNASAIGIYGLDNPSIIYTEDNSIDYNKHADFLAEVGAKWEQSLHEAELLGLRVLKLRFAVVLDWEGGALAKMALPFKLGLGGRIGTGKQAFSWIARTDLIRIIIELIQDPNVSGAINLVAPAVTTQIQFARKLAKYLHRPCIAPMPGFIVKLLFGQMGEELLLKGQKVCSVKLKNYYKNWLYPDLDKFFKL